MRMAYEMEAATPDTDVYVMPLPYYYKEYDGSFKDEMHIDTEEFIKANIPVTDYSRFDLSLLCPEKIYINSAYDEYNMAVSVDTRFFTDIKSSCNLFNIQFFSFSCDFNICFH